MRKLLKFLTLLLAALIAVSAYALYPPEVRRIQFPNGKRFAFTIVDDTDMVKLDRVRPVYQMLEKYGLRTTKTLWVLNTKEESNLANSGDTLHDESYRRFIIDLQNKGFEIALHGVRGGSSTREDVLEGLDKFKDALGQYPRMQVNHSLNRDNIYWGRHLFSFGPYRWASSFFIPHAFEGHTPGSAYFWGDVAKERIQYIRRFTYPEINLLNISPEFPYRLTDKPYVNYWFPTANGNHARDFYELLKPENLEELERQGGVCLVYAHLGSGSFNKEGGVDPRFETRLKQLTARPGWFVPASAILDHLRRQPGWTGDLSFRARLRSETRFVVYRVIHGVE